MSKPFAEATIQGIAFTFERHACGQWCGHAGYAIGMSNVEKVYGTRIGVCAKYLYFSPESWAGSPSGEQHIWGIARRREKEADHQALQEEAGIQPGFDAIFYNERRASYSVHFNGLPRAQAVAIYRAVTMPKAEAGDA